MILSDTGILDAMYRGEIVIDPFHRHALGGNSYDVHLGETLLVYKGPTGEADRWYGPGGAVHRILDAKQENPTEEIVIPEPEGYVLEPGMLYLASTIEYTETHRHVPVLDGKSSIGRLGMAIHVTAGFGDVGFCNHWTMEIFVIHPVRVYVGMPVGQLRFHVVNGEVRTPYARKPGAKYSSRDPKPQPSRMYKNFLQEP
jgi:dCTP deaminase